MLNYFLYWLRGYAYITVYGKRKEQFLNLALQQNILIYDIHSGEEKDGYIISKVSFRDLGKLREIAKKTSCSLKTGRYGGLPIFCGFLKKRKMIFCGLFLFCFGLYILSGFVWFVEVTPKESIKHLNGKDIVCCGEKYGIRRGAWGRNLDFDTISKKLVAEIPELSWVSIERKGILINYNIAERDILTEEEVNADNGYIVADKTSLLEDVLIKQGKAVAKSGQWVKKGDILVSPSNNGKSEAIIRGRVWYEGYGECALKNVKQVATGKGRRSLYLVKESNADNSAYFLKIFTFGKANPTQSKHSKNHDTQIKIEKEYIRPVLFGKVQMPLCFLLKKEIPTLEQTTEVTEKKAKQKALNEARKSLRQQIGEGNMVLSEKMEYHLREGVCSITVKWECREEIGTTKTKAGNEK